MNLLHMKYAVEIAETKSINKAAEKLFVGQSALSRAIKELETSLGVTLLERSSTGMSPTPDGEVFVRYAKTVLKQVDAIENMFSDDHAARTQFSISVPRASYISDAFAKFSKLIGKDTEAEFFYKETNALRAIKNLLNDEFKLGIIRYAESFDKYYKNMMDEKGLEYELITEFRYKLLYHKDSPLAKKEEVTYDDLRNLVMIAHADPYVPSLPFSEGKKEELPDNSDRKIFIFERASQFELLAENHETFMWSSPIPQTLLDRYGLVQKYCVDNKRVYKDVLIHRRDYTLSEIDNMFIEELVKSKRRTFGEET